MWYYVGVKHTREECESKRFYVFVCLDPVSCYFFFVSSYTRWWKRFYKIIHANCLWNIYQDGNDSNSNEVG